mmetsp:Transcript_20477/g.40542  ORF Transcript_20477/g.40542 Transcript_20477/m.40542 type:complete len:215 (-) Transcript_20477:105-749(-)|eukprot:CAMPEP_0175155142 /NCGR_PEP_ID=MMETSP0087-20121206/20793_1 /TAXON_ID=136419 /ORGANISM="Unknown Unknown, Strain D1" /LENGTH=214 /DNA_ID=CAMNT_0016442229 /DNA_START=19 /DNA_END=663 /DNA_ORIENTATION=-
MMLSRTGSGVAAYLRRSPASGLFSSPVRNTTILCVRKDGKVAMVGDGQVSLGNTVMKPNARKVRELCDGKVLAGFAGATADCFTLLERLEAKLEEFPGQTLRASVELAKMWRNEKYMRHLEAMIVVADKDISLTITGRGDVAEPVDGVIGIGSGGVYAASAARALVDVEGFSALAIAQKGMKIAADTCVYTNHEFITKELDSTPDNNTPPSPSS